MNNFSYQSKTEIKFGRDTEKEVGKLVAKYGKKVLLHYGGGSIKKNGLYDTVIKSLKSEGIEIFELDGVKPNPRVTLIREGIDLCRKESIDFILAVGGGSVIDSAKGIGIGVNYEGDVWDFYDYKVAPEKMLPLGVILTLPAAGSETSPSSVVTNEAEKLKRGLTADCMRPEFCLINPEITYTLPPYQTSCGISDMLAHTMERYFTPTKNVELSDRLLESVMITIMSQAKKLIRDPKNYDHRAEIMWAGTLCHNDFIDSGRTGDWASHGIEHELSALNDVAHGAGLSIIFPAWMKHVYNQDIERFVQFADRVFGIDTSSISKEEAAKQAIDKLEDFYKHLNLPTRLSEVEFQESYIIEMAKKATNGDTSTIGSFKKLKQSDVESIIKLAL